METNLDLSFSGLADTVQGDKAKGSVVLAELTRQYAVEEKAIAACKEALNSHLIQLRLLHDGVGHVINHLHLETPLVLSSPENIVIINDKSIVSYSNIL